MKNTAKIALLYLIIPLGGCSTLKLDIKSPSHGAAIGAGTINLLSSVHFNEPHPAPDTCDTVDWRIQIDGRTVCSGTGLAGNGRHAWCSPEITPPCTLIWRNIPTSDIGSGAHTIRVSADIGGQQGGDDITVNLP